MRSATSRVDGDISDPLGIFSSFKTNREILGSPFSLPASISFEAYAIVFTQYDFLNYFQNSLMIAVSSTLIALFIYSLAGYVFAKYDFKGKMLLFTLCTITLLVPGHAKERLDLFSLHYGAWTLRYKNRFDFGLYLRSAWRLRCSFCGRAL